jgi:hypothetical protein
MSVAEVRDRIGSDRYHLLTGNDRRPLFVELLAGHEGISAGRFAPLRGRGRRAKKFWSREMIAALAERMRSGVPVFLSHEAFDRRRQIGEVIAAGERWVKGILTAVGIAHITDPEARARIVSGELDTCSIEAEVGCHRSAGTDDPVWVVDAVRKVTGVALGNSRTHRPGFPAAAVLGVVAEFEATAEAAADSPAAEAGS